MIAILKQKIVDMIVSELTNGRIETNVPAFTDEDIALFIEYNEKNIQNTIDILIDKNKDTNIDTDIKEHLHIFWNYMEHYLYAGSFFIIPLKTGNIIVNHYTQSTNKV